MDEKKKREVDEKPRKGRAENGDVAGVSPNAWKFMTREQIAELLGVSPDTVTDWTSQRGLPVSIKGGHSKRSVNDAVAVMKWRRQQAESKEIDAKDVAQTRVYTAQAELNELKLLREQGKVIDRDDVIRAGRALLKALSSKLRSLPRRLVQVGAVAREQEAEAVTIVREFQTELATWRTLAELEAAASADGGQQ